MGEDTKDALLFDALAECIEAHADIIKLKRIVAFMCIVNAGLVLYILHLLG